MPSYFLLVAVPAPFKKAGGRGNSSIGNLKCFPAVKKLHGHGAALAGAPPNDSRKWFSIWKNQTGFRSGKIKLKKIFSLQEGRIIFKTKCFVNFGGAMFVEQTVRNHPAYIRKTDLELSEFFFG
jgi:hypothetical protein